MRLEGFIYPAQLSLMFSSKPVRSIQAYQSLPVKSESDVTKGSKYHRSIDIAIRIAYACYVACLNCMRCHEHAYMPSDVGSRSACTDGIEILSSSMPGTELAFIRSCLDQLLWRNDVPSDCAAKRPIHLPIPMPAIQIPAYTHGTRSTALDRPLCFMIRACYVMLLWLYNQVVRFRSSTSICDSFVHEVIPGFPEMNRHGSKI